MERAFVSLCVAVRGTSRCPLPTLSVAQMTDVAVRCASARVFCNLLCRRVRSLAVSKCQSQKSSYTPQLAAHPCSSVRPSSSDERLLLRARVSRHRRGCEANKARLRLKAKRTNDDLQASPRCVRSACGMWHAGV